MTLLDLQQVTIAFGGPPLLDGARLAIARGDRICLLGRNGTGKSTLLKLLDGTLSPDAGDIVRHGAVTVARLDQELPSDVRGSTFDVAAGGLGVLGALLARYHAASVRVATDSSDRALAELDRLHAELDAADAWQLQTRVDAVLDRLALDADAAFESLSVGRKRQVLLARALVAQPDLLLLDEPTNHLDIEAIERMETLLVDGGITLVFVTHDRAFLRRVATRIVELDRGRVTDWGDSYDSYLARKAQALAAEEREWAEFDRKLAQEEVWIRTGIQARRTRNEGRVRSLEAMRVERQGRRERTGNVRLQAQEADRSGRVVFEASHVGFARDGRAIVRDFSTVITRGDRVGFIGPNGVGKTTLLRLLLGELTPDMGTVRHGTNIEIAYFDQLREQLDPDRSVFDVVAEGNEFVEVHGNRMHVHGYLGNFLFGPERARTPVRALSGGERNRLLLARLFTRRFNVLVLDEPTNDLDLETLDLLEELLLEFRGTLLLVSHDRAFLDNVVTSSLVFEGAATVNEYVGGYSDWLRQRRPATPGDTKTTARPGVRPTSPTPAATDTRPARKKRLSFAESRELEGLPDRIDALEQERDGLYASLADTQFLRDGARVTAARERLDGIDQELAALFARWEVLDAIASA